MEDSLIKFIKLTLGAICLFLVLSIIYFQPHWGLMDDSYLSTIVLKQIQDIGLWGYTVFFTKEDSTGWGMFRPLYPTMAYFIYAPGMKFGVMYSFLLNLAFSVGVLVYQCNVLSKILRVSIWPVLLFLSAFFYQYDLFQYPSLQEKMVLLAGTFFLQLCYTKSIKSPFVHFFLLVFSLAVGVSTKASFMIFYSMGFWAFLSSNSVELFRQKKLRSWFFLLSLGVLGILAILFLGKISSQGSYTQQYDLAKVVPNLISKEGILFLVPLVLGGINLIYLKKRASLRWEDALPVVGISAFLAIFLPWGIKAYIQSIIGPVYALLWVSILFGVLSFVPSRWWAYPLMALCLLIAGYRSLSMFSRLGDIGIIVRQLRSNAFPEVKTIWVPCMEGTDSFRRFVNQDVPNRYEVRFWQQFDDSNGKYAFFDNALCPLPNRADSIDGCEVEILSRGIWNRSFRLAKFNCSK